MDKKAFTEADIRTKFITPALVGPGGKWNVMTQLREEVYFTKGRVIVRGSWRAHMRSWLAKLLQATAGCFDILRSRAPLKKKRKAADRLGVLVNR